MKKGDKVLCKRTYTKNMYSNNFSYYDCIVFLEGAIYEISDIDSDNFLFIYSKTTDTVQVISNNFFNKYFKTVKEIRREKLEKLKVK